MTGRFRRPVLLAVLGLAACDGGGVTPPPTGETAELSMTLTRQLNSAVPSQADSALVRVWHPTAGTNQVQAVAIPSPGASTSVNFTLPARTGYSVGVIAYRGANMITRVGLAGGTTTGVNVLPGQANAASVNVVPWQFSVTAPDTLLAGEKATVAITPSTSLAPFIGTGGAALHQHMKPLQDTSYVSTSSYASQDGTGKFTFQITTPTVSGDTALYMRLSASVDFSEWQINTRPIAIFSPSSTLMQPQIRRPIKVAGGSLTVSFARDGRR